MDPVAFCQMLVDGIPAGVHRRLDDLSEEQLHWRAASKSNPIGFILWHTLRAVDLNLGRLRGLTPDDEIWQTAGFSQRTGYDPRGLGLRGIGIGTGYTQAMVEAVPWTKEIIGAYTEEIHKGLTEYFRTSSADDMDVETTNIVGASVKKAQIFEIAYRQLLQHLGEADIIRGLMGIPDATMPREEQE